MALVAVRRVGVCGTDFHAWRGHQPFFSYPRVLGHELAVVVDAVGAGVTNVVPGDACAVEPYLNCGTCGACRRGRTNCCERLQVLGVHVDGGMRERLVVPAGKLHGSRRLSLDALALVETLGIGAHAVRRAGPEAGEWALVAGAGPIGLGVAIFAHAAGARVVVSDPLPARRTFCAGRLPEAIVLDPAEAPLAEQLRATCGELPRLVFDATGNATSMRASFDVVGHAGTLVYVGLFQGDLVFPDPEFHKRELTLRASRNASAADVTRVMELLEAGRVDVQPWITHRAGLAEVPAVFPSWTQPEAGVVKAMIEI